MLPTLKCQPQPGGLYLKLTSFDGLGTWGIEFSLSKPCISWNDSHRCWYVSSPFRYRRVACQIGGLKARGGAVVIIGPFPIIFGSDKESAKILLVLSIILVGALIALFLVQGYF